MGYILCNKGLTGVAAISKKILMHRRNSIAPNHTGNMKQMCLPKAILQYRKHRTKFLAFSCQQICIYPIKLQDIICFHLFRFIYKAYWLKYYILQKTILL